MLKIGGTLKFLSNHVWNWSSNRLESEHDFEGLRMNSIEFHLHQKSLSIYVLTISIIWESIE
tara:strand:- start:24866 stop:25051 length:186 start_codon:yes stop_codon:yes gene_type:complete